MNKFTQLRTRGVALKTAIAAGAMASTAAANAALPAWASDLATDTGQAVTDASTAVGPVIIASLVAVIIIKLIKRFANKI